MRDTHTERQRHRQREKQAPSKEPDVGLHPGSPGSHPGLKAAPNRWAIGAASFPFNQTVLRYLRDGMWPRQTSKRKGPM